MSDLSSHSMAQPSLSLKPAKEVATTNSTTKSQTEDSDSLSSRASILNVRGNFVLLGFFPSNFALMAILIS